MNGNCLCPAVSPWSGTCAGGQNLQSVSAVRSPGEAMEGGAQMCGNVGTSVSAVARFQAQRTLIAQGILYFLHQESHSWREILKWNYFLKNTKDTSMLRSNYSFLFGIFVFFLKKKKNRQFASQSLPPHRTMMLLQRLRGEAWIILLTLPYGMFNKDLKKWCRENAFDPVTAEASTTHSSVQAGETIPGLIDEKHEIVH